MNAGPVGSSSECSSFGLALPGLGTAPSILQPPSAHLGAGSTFMEPWGTQVFERLAAPWAPVPSAKKPQLLWRLLSSYGEKLVG